MPPQALVISHLNKPLPSLPTDEILPKLILTEEPPPSGPELLPDPPAPALPPEPILPAMPYLWPEELLADPEKPRFPDRPIKPSILNEQVIQHSLRAMEQIVTPYQVECQKALMTARQEIERRNTRIETLKNDILSILEEVENQSKKSWVEAKTLGQTYRDREASYKSSCSNKIYELKAKGREAAFDSYLKSVSIFDFIDTYPRLTKFLAQTMDAYGVANAHDLITQVLNGSLEIPKCGPVTKINLNIWVNCVVVPNFREDSTQKFDMMEFQGIDIEYTKGKEIIEHGLRNKSKELEDTKREMIKVNQVMVDMENLRSEKDSYGQIVQSIVAEMAEFQNSINAMENNGK